MASTKKKREKRKQSAAKRRAMEHGSSDRTTIKVPDGLSFMKVKEGIMKFDIVGFKAGKGNPWADAGELYYERTFWVHRNVGPDGDAYVCPAKTAKKKCPICQHRAKLASDPDADEQLVKDLLPKERQLFLVFNHSEKDKGLQLLEISHHNFGKRLDAEVRDAEDDEDVESFYAHSKDDGGKTLKVGWVEDSFAGTSFFKADTIKFLPRAKDLDDELLENIVCLDDLIIIEDYDKLKKIYLQSPEKGEEDDDEDEDEDTDTDSDDEEDEDDEDEKPSKKKGKPKKSKSKDDEDEDDEEDDDDSEEDEDDSDDDEDDEDDDDEDDENDYGDFKVGSKVKGEYKGKDFTGEVFKLENGLVHVLTSKGNKRTCDPDELELLSSKKKSKKDEEDDEEEEESPKSSKKSKSSKGSSKKASKEDDDDDEDDDIPFEDEDEDDEEEKPKKKKKK